METTTANDSRLQNALNQDYEFKMGQYISTGFDIFKKEPWLYMGFLVVYIVIAVTVSSLVTNFVLSTVLSACVSVPLGVGYFIVANKIRNNHTAQFGDFFGGYKLFVPLMLNYLVQSLLFLLIFSPGIIYFLVSVDAFSDLLSGANQVEIMTKVASLIITLPVVIILFFVSILLVIYFSISFIFSQMFIVFNELDFWTALKTSMKLVNKKWFSFFGLLLVLFLINILGMLCLVFGLLVTLPASACAIYAAFEDIAGASVGAVDSELTSSILDA